MPLSTAACNGLSECDATIRIAPLLRSVALMKHQALIAAALVASFCAPIAAARDESRASPEAAVVAAFSKVCLDARTSDASRQVVEAMKGVLEPSAADTMFGDRFTYRLRVHRVTVRA